MVICGQVYLHSLLLGRFDAHLDSASSDETVRVLVGKSSNSNEKYAKDPKPITHPVAVRAILPLPFTDLGEPYLLTAAGDTLRTYDISELDEPELLSQVDAHWHDITAIRLWKRKILREDGGARIEPWIVTTSLDKTIRKWKLTGQCDPNFLFFAGLTSWVLTIRSPAELLHPPKPVISEPVPKAEVPKATLRESDLTEEEERELAELMED
jgi:WD40 repeat protein